MDIINNKVKQVLMTVVLVISTVFICFSQEEANWKIDFDLSLQKHDDRIVRIDHWATGPGVYQGSLYASRSILNSSSKLDVLVGGGLGFEFMTSNGEFNGKLFDEITKEYELITRYSKFLALSNGEIKFKVTSSYNLHLQALTSLGIFRQVKNTREISGTIDYSDFDIFYNDTEFNLFVSREAKMFDIKFGYRLAHLKVDNALFFDAKPGNETIPQEDWVHNSTFDTVNPLKIFFGLSFDF